METADIPQCIAGYNVSAKLGTGSFATVYKGTSVAPRANGVRETVAIKCIDRRSAIATRMSSDNVVSEIAILKKMKHRNIVQLLDFQWDKKYIYMIIEFCGGGDLSSFIRLHQCLPERVAHKFFRQLASAIKYFRSFNIAHMDLKPQNILLTSQHRPVLKVADFGFAQHLREEAGQGNSFRGSPLYMAPEIFTRQKYDARVDLWSCGVILYECLYGKAPFACASMEDLIKQITSHESIKLPTTVPLSDDCIDLLKGLLVRNPSHRMCFDEFFSHPFVDLEHAPSDASLERANSLIIKSDAACSQGKRVEAVKLITEAIGLYLPALQLIEDEVERQRMREKVRGYLRHAENLKKELLRPDARPPDTARSSSFDRIDLLEELWSDTPQVRASILVVNKGEELEAKEKWSEALDKYQLAIEAMLQVLNRETPGRRRDVLRSRVDRWLRRAEQLQLYVDVGKLNLSKVAETERAEAAIEEDTEQIAKQNQCLVQ